MQKLAMLLVFMALLLASNLSKTKEPFFKTGFIFEPNPQMPMNHASSIIVLPDQDVLCAWYSGTKEGAKDVKIYSSRYSRKEKIWSPVKVIADTPNRSEGNPVLFLAPDGKIWLFFVTIEGTGWAMASIKYCISDDGGESFGPANYFREKWGWMTRNHFLTLSTGEILLPLYSELKWESVFMVSRDGMKSFENAGVIKSKPGNIQPAVVELDDGKLLALMRTGGRGGKIWRAYSYDRGMSWTEAVQVELPNPNAGIDLVRLGSGELVLAFNNSDKRRTPLSVALSKDQGESWPYIRDLETGDGEYSYPSLATDREGNIWLSYTYKRESIKYAVFNIQWLMGKDKE